MHRGQGFEMKSESYSSGALPENDDDYLQNLVTNRNVTCKELVLAQWFL